MIDLTHIIIVLAVHFFFDWFQPRSIQNIKHKDNLALCAHSTISGFSVALTICMLTGQINLLFVIGTCLILIHFVQDYITSRISNWSKEKLKKTGKTRFEYFLITNTAIDQFLHLTVYFICYYLLTT